MSLPFGITINPLNAFVRILQLNTLCSTLLTSKTLLKTCWHPTDRFNKWTSYWARQKQDLIVNRWLKICWTFIGRCLYLFRCPQRYGPWNEHRSFHPKKYFCAQAVTKSANHNFFNCLQLLVSFMVKRIHFCPFGGGFLPKVRLLGIQVVVLAKMPLYPLQYDST